MVATLIQLPLLYLFTKAVDGGGGEHLGKHKLLFLVSMNETPINVGQTNMVTLML